MNRRSSAIALLAAVFFAGVAATLATLRVVEHRRDPAPELERRTFWRGEPPPRPDRRAGFPATPPFTELARTRVTEHMTEALDLTDDQRVRIEEAFERRRVATQETMNRIMPRLRSQMDSLNAEIEGILSPEQRAAFEEYLNEDRDRFHRRGGRLSRWGERSR